MDIFTIGTHVRFAPQKIVLKNSHRADLWTQMYTIWTRSLFLSKKAEKYQDLVAHLHS